MIFKFNRKGFTLLELLVAVAVTGLLAALLLNITTQVVTTQTKATGDLETNQAAQFILDRIQEDLQCAVYRNDGSVCGWRQQFWKITTNSSVWEPAERGKPTTTSLRVTADDWEGPDGEADDIVTANNQWSLVDSRFGVGGTWLRFFPKHLSLTPKPITRGESGQ